DPNLPDPRLQKIQTTALTSVLRIESRSPQNGDDDVIFGNAGNDIVVAGAGHDMADGDEGEDFLFGDNAWLIRRIGGVDTFTSPHFQALLAAIMYGRSDQAPNPVADLSGALLTDGVWRNYRTPAGAPWWAEYLVTELLHTFSINDGVTGKGSFGNDYLAGGEGHDVILGQLGNDVIQGDGGIDLAFAATSHVGASRTSGGVADPVGPLTVVASFEAATDGEDYIEGGGGNDVIFGGLGQDDIVGGSSTFYSLDLRDERPDGEDYIFGGAGTQIDRNNANLPVSTTAADRHARDADTIVGDNGNIIRIVGINGTDSGSYVRFNYDNYGTQRLVARGVSLLDYTPGGPDFKPTVAPSDLGGSDEVHGETGDDTVYTGRGDDRIFGDGDDDDLIGGWGSDWISGGTGQDGILGDDGRIFTSRNSSTFGEPLYGIAAIPAAELSLFIATPGQIQTATINVANALKKTVDLTPFNLRPNEEGGDDPLFDPRYADDLIYGGLGDDFLHGGSGDDGIVGSEALNESYGQRYDAQGNLLGLVRSDWTRPYNGGDMLHFGADTDAWHSNPHNADKLGEFALYDEYDPRRVIRLNPDGTKVISGTGGVEWLLNFVSNEGVSIPDATWGTAFSDGDDVVFGDLGNDWLVGGTGKDTLWGGWGNDLSNADDKLGTTGSGSTDESPDTHPSYEDRVFGGAGLDVLIGNTGGDRLIDWVGEFNSYIVPFAPFGIATISRQRPPALDEFLYRLSRSQGADPTRAADTGRDVARNGEPDGEMGLVTQKDHGLWQDQTGGPTDPQPGNIPGGRRDVLRSADFNDGSTQAFFRDSGTWEVVGGQLRVAAASQGGDAAAVWNIEGYLPIYYEVEADVQFQRPQMGWKGNAYVIFDYFSPTDFKFAGLDTATNKIVMGHRNASGWIVDAWTPFQTMPDRFYHMLVAVNGTTVTVLVNNANSFTWTYPARILDGVPVALNKGLIGMGSDNSRGIFDNIKANVLPPQLTFDETEDFEDGVADRFNGRKSGDWHVAGGRFMGTPATAGSSGYATINLATSIAPASYVELETVLRTTNMGGLFFDGYSDNSYKFVALDVQAQKVLIGHWEARRGFVIDASFTRVLNPGTDYTLNLVMRGAAVSVTLNGAFIGSYGFNSAIVDGDLGLYARGGTVSFDNVRLRTNDPQFGTEGLSATATTAGTTSMPMGTAAVATASSTADAVGDAVTMFYLADIPEYSTVKVTPLRDCVSAG
ncbi:MAG TPA: hypothetical protein VFC19_02330, partial [Candidatus Limnocylindrales bacterium]|nr:hypothetical protein [Candidatus Limnocylindrales bacterium]